MSYTINVDTLKRQFHSRSVTFNKFINITEEDIARIKKMISSRAQSKVNNGINLYPGLNNYINTLRYLTNPTILKDLSTFDEKILYLILSCDPDFETMKTFISSEITPSSYIDDEEDETKKRNLKEKRKQELQAYSDQVRNKIGFYDGNLLKYESILSRGLFKKQGFLSDIKIPSLKTIFEHAGIIKNLNIINEVNLTRLQAIRDKWLEEAKDPSDLNSLAYNLLNRYKDLGIYTVEEQIIVFMLIADPELNLLKIYEEESNFNRMQTRAKEELGFFSKGLINVEQLYHDKFEPDKKLSAWTM